MISAPCGKPNPCQITKFNPAIVFCFFKNNNNRDQSTKGRKMVARLNNQDSEFDTKFQALLSAKRESAADVNQAVSEIINNVRTNGDAALYELTARYDHLDLKDKGLAITNDEIDLAIKNVPTETMQALELAAARIESHHQKQKPDDQRYTDELGIELGYRWSPVSAAGLYVPGGTASYPSSVLMNAIPAKVAGVERLVMVVPTPNDVTNPLVLAAAKLAGIKEIYRIGGAQAIAALTYGTETISPVDKIVGPGNAYVAAAKRQVFGTVGIDMIAGPSEVLIIADKNNNPDWIAADLLAQAEHDVAAQSILITECEDLANEVEKAVEARLKTLPRGEIAGKAWQEFGAIILVDDLEKAAALSDRLAPEHLELALDDPESMFAKIKHAGAVFIGHHTPPFLQHG